MCKQRISPDPCHVSSLFHENDFIKLHQIWFSTTTTRRSVIVVEWTWKLSTGYEVCSFYLFFLYYTTRFTFANLFFVCTYCGKEETFEWKWDYNLFSLKVIFLPVVQIDKIAREFATIPILRRRSSPQIFSITDLIFLLQWISLGESKINLKYDIVALSSSWHCWLSPKRSNKI